MENMVDLCIALVFRGLIVAYSSGTVFGETITWVSADPENRPCSRHM